MLNASGLTQDKHPLYLNEKEHFGTGQHYVILVFFIYLFFFGVKYPKNRKNRKKKMVMSHFHCFRQVYSKIIIIVRNFIIKKHSLLGALPK
jgi:hypothetical protein